MQRNLLTARDALNIAAQHGFSIRTHRKLIRDGIIEARETEYLPLFPGRRKSAIQYFDEYMARVRAT